MKNEKEVAVKMIKQIKDELQQKCVFLADLIHALRNNIVNFTDKYKIN